MDKINIDRQWKLRAMDSLTLKMKELRTVDLPHDYCIEQKMDPFTAATASNAYLPGGYIEYEKTIMIPGEWKGKKIAVEFEGVYMNATVRINKSIAGRHPYGYTGFHCDLTPHIRYGEANILCVSVNNSALPNTRWYSGMGIYRHVWLLTGAEIHIEPWGVFVTTPAISKEETVFNIKTKISSISPTEETFYIRQTLLDKSGKAVSKTEAEYIFSGGEAIEAEQEISIANANLWDIENPYLYTILTEIIFREKIIDSSITTAGVRSISFEPENGFMLNGRRVKLKGGCVHHDCGILGSASHDRAEIRKAELLKQNGYNAVRCAHNPPAPAFLDACDRLGLVVMDEAFDCWNEPKMTNDYSLFFNDWWEKDLSAMILRDRNHPSVIMWSVGNEIPERDGHSNGYELSRRLSDYVRALDKTRAVTNAVCGLWRDGDWAQLTAPFSEPLDVVGYNYLLERYDIDGNLFPNRIICGTETYPMQAFDYWEAVEKHPYVIGDFVWTAIDYLGEAGIGRAKEENDILFCGKYPWSHAYCGDIDLCGFKRPQSYYRDCVWGINKKPYIAAHDPEHYGQNRELTPWSWPEVYNSWNWPSYEGKPVKVDIYSADDEVELFLNSVSLGRKKAGKENKYIASYDLSYESGEILCVSYTDGKETAREALVTPSEAYRIELTADRGSLTDGTGDICYITARILDRNGNISDNADNALYVCAQGAGKVIAIGSSNPKTDEPYTGNARKCYRGILTAVIAAQADEGEVVVNASAEGLVAASIKIEIKREMSIK